MTRTLHNAIPDAGAERPALGDVQILGELALIRHLQYLVLQPLLAVQHDSILDAYVPRLDHLNSLQSRMHTSFIGTRWLK